MENQILQGVQTKCKFIQSSFKTGAQQLCLASTVSPALGTDEQLCQRNAHTDTVQGSKSHRTSQETYHGALELNPFSHRITQNCWGWKGPLKFILSNTPQVFLISLMILPGLPAMKNINTHNPENRILMNILQSPDPQG